MDKMTYLGKANGKPFASQSTAQYYMTTHGINGTVVPAEGYGFVVRTSNGASQDKTRVFTPDRVKDPSVSKEQEIQYEDIPWMKEDPSPQPEAQEVPEANAGNQEDYEQYAQARQKGKLSNAPNRKLTPEESEKWLDKHSGTISDVLGVPEKEPVPEKPKKSKKKKKKKPVERSSIQDLFKGTEFEDFKKSDDFGSFDTRQKDIYEWLAEDKPEEEKEETSFTVPAPIPEIKRRAFTEGEFLGKEGGMSTTSTGVSSHDNFSGRVFDADPFIRIEDKRTKEIVEHSKESQNTSRGVQKIHEGEFLGKEGGLNKPDSNNFSGRVFEGEVTPKMLGGGSGGDDKPPEKPSGESMDEPDRFPARYESFGLQRLLDTPKEDEKVDDKGVEEFNKELAKAGKRLGSFASVLETINAIASQTTKEKQESSASGFTRERLAGLVDQLPNVRRELMEQSLGNVSRLSQNVQQDPSALSSILTRVATANALNGGAQLDLSSLSTGLLKGDKTQIFNTMVDWRNRTEKTLGKDDAATAFASVGSAVGLPNLAMFDQKLKNKDAKRDEVTNTIERGVIHVENAKISLLGGDFKQAASHGLGAFNAAADTAEQGVKDVIRSTLSKDSADSTIKFLDDANTSFMKAQVDAMNSVKGAYNSVVDFFSDDKSSATKNLGAPAEHAQKELDMRGRAVVKVSLIDDKTGKEVGKGTAEMQSAKTVNKFN